MSRSRGGLATQTIHLPGPDDEPLPEAADISVEDGNDDADRPLVNDNGDTISIEHGDGSVTISLDGSPVQDAQNDDNPAGWFDNLALKIDRDELGRISETLLRGVDQDIASRRDWLESQATGVRLLGITLEDAAAGQGSADAAPVEGQSQVRHPLLLEAVLRFNANARSEFLPTDGPAKIKDDNPSGQSEDRAQEADALEVDFNHFLTSTASEYYPDTDRMLLKVGFCGDGFKKVYFCPLRNRPASESVEAKDLIVNNSATDLGNARRITHRIMMRPSVAKRLQILGVYRDIDLGDPAPPKADSLRDEEKAQQGIDQSSMDPLDRDREIYEAYCELDIRGFEHKHKGKVSGLEVPYRVTIDVSSREVLAITRNYDEATSELPIARKVFVKYPYVPGFGFYDIGLLHILGNTTRAVTAGWRELLDAGQFANFPGFLIAKAATRQQTNIFRIPPGGGQQVDTNGMNIREAVMPLPYNAQGMPALMDLIENMVETGQRLGGTAETNVGEGRQDAPVGTTLALIEQATKIENAVHKRLHTAQSEEFQLLIQCFREHPESFWQREHASAYPWDEATFLKALDDYDLVPQADPNTASHIQRVMRAMALGQAAQQAPQIFNVQKVAETVIRAMGFSDPQTYLNPTPQPDPKAIAAQSKAKADDASSQAAVTTANARMLEARTTAAQPPQGLATGPQPPQPEPPDPVKVAQLQLQRQELVQDHQQDMLEAENRERDRESSERVAAAQLIEKMLQDPNGIEMLRRHGYLPDGFIERLESNETPIAGLPDSPDQPQPE